MHSSRRARPAIRRWRCSLAGTTGSAGRRWSGAGRAAIVVWSTLARILAVAQRQVVDAMTSCRASPPSPSSWPTSVVVAATHWQVRSASAAWRQPGDRRNRRPQRGCRKARARNPLRPAARDPARGNRPHPNCRRDAESGSTAVPFPPCNLLRPRRARRVHQSSPPRRLQPSPKSHSLGTLNPTNLWTLVKR